MVGLGGKREREAMLNILKKPFLGLQEGADPEKHLDTQFPAGSGLRVLSISTSSPDLRDSSGADISLSVHMKPVCSV